MSLSTPGESVPTYPEQLATYLASSFSRLAQYGQVITAIVSANATSALHPNHEAMYAGMLKSVTGPVEEFLQAGYQVRLDPPEGYPFNNPLRLVELQEHDRYFENIKVLAIPLPGPFFDRAPSASFPVRTPTLIEAIRNSSAPLVPPVPHL